jgi:hypothetical protein
MFADSFPDRRKWSLGVKVLIGDSVDNLGDSCFTQSLGTVRAGLGEAGLSCPVDPCYINGSSTGITDAGQCIYLSMDGDILTASFIMKDSCGGDVVSPLISPDGQNTAGTDNDGTVPLMAIR